MPANDLDSVAKLQAVTIALAAVLGVLTLGGDASGPTGGRQQADAVRRRLGLIPPLQLRPQAPRDGDVPLIQVSAVQHATGSEVPAVTLQIFNHLFQPRDGVIEAAGTVGRLAGGSPSKSPCRRAEMLPTADGRWRLASGLWSPRHFIETSEPVGLRSA
jgi:hypothetical protein